LSRRLAGYFACRDTASTIERAAEIPLARAPDVRPGPPNEALLVLLADACLDYADALLAD
jgi:hypothetical protein